MKKVLKGTIFFIGLLILLSILSSIFIPKNNTKEDGMIDEAASGILSEKDNSIDVLFVGNSVIYTSIIPMKIWEDYGIPSYVLYSPGQPLEESIYFTYMATLKQKTKVIVLEASNIFLRNDIEYSIRNVLSAVYPIFRYHDRWKKLSLKDITSGTNYKRIDDNKGYGFSLNIRPIENNNYMEETTEEEIIPRLNMFYIKLLNYYCNSNDIKFILTAAPSIDNWNYKKHNALERLSNDENIPFVDMNLVEEINIDWSHDTRDEGDHLNYYGAKKATEYFGKYLNDLNILKDHREDKKYKEWNESLERFNKKVEEETKNTN